MGPERRKISFPADSILNAVVQDGDLDELLRILHRPRGTVNLDQPNHVGLTALHHGVLSNNLDAIKILVCNGASVNIQDIHGFTPLHTAAACAFVNVATMLILNGADLFSTTREGELPIDVAKDITMIRLLSIEMRAHIQQEVYYSAFFKVKCWELWNLTLKGLSIAIRSCAEASRTLFSNFKERLKKD